MERIYFPMTANTLVAGHIRCLEQLTTMGEVVVGLLTSEALIGYKKEKMPYKDRELILKSLKFDMEVVPQYELNPAKNIWKYDCQAIASGDGFNEEEEKAIKELNIKKINLNSGCPIHSSDIQ